MEEDELNTEEVSKDIKNFWNKLTVEHLLIILLLMLMLLMYVYHTKEISRCVTYFNGLLQNQTFPIVI